MLRKLLKYDLKNIFKFLIIFYSLALFFALLSRIFLNIENSFIMYVIGEICRGASISMMFSIIINNLMRLWVRFKSNFYGDESYLTHTLPIEKKTLYLSKIITALITLFTSVLIIGIALVIAYYSKDLLDIVKSLLLPIANLYNSNIIVILIAFIFILFLEFMNILQCGFTGLILGHKMNNAKVGYSVLFGFISFLVSQTIVVIMVFIVALFNKDIMNLIFTNEMISIASTKLIIYMAIIMYTIIIVISYFINIILFKKGVNVE